MRQTKTAPPLSAALIVMSAFTKVQKCGPFIGFEVERSTVAIEFEFRNIVLALLEEKVYCSELAIGRSPFRFAVVVEKRFKLYALKEFFKVFFD